MSHIEELVRSTLREHAADAPGALATADGVRARLRRRRLRAGMALGVSAAVVVAVVVVAAVRHDDRTGVLTGPTTSTVALAPTQTVSYQGLELDVPADWKLHATRCGTPVANTVLTGVDAGGELCSIRGLPGLTVVRIDSLGDHNPIAAFATQPVTISGHAALRGTGTTPTTVYPPATELDVLVIPDIDTIVTVESPDRQQRAAILDTARVVAADANGCATHVGSLSPPQSNGAASASALVPAGVLSATICRYATDFVRQSVALDAERANAFADVLNSLPEGLSYADFDTSATELCANEDHRGFIFHFFYADAKTVDVYVHISGCHGFGASNGTRTTKINDALVFPLVDAAGYDFSFPDPRNLH